MGRIFGRVLLTGATSLRDCSDHLADRQPGMSWAHVDDGILFLWEDHTDEEAAALYAGFVPDRTATDEPPDPAVIRDHLQHLLDFRRAVRTGTDGSITAAQTRHVLADVIDALRLVSRYFDTSD